MTVWRSVLGALLQAQTKRSICQDKICCSINVFVSLWTNHFLISSINLYPTHPVTPPHWSFIVGFGVALFSVGVFPKVSIKIRHFPHTIYVYWNEKCTETIVAWGENPYRYCVPSKYLCQTSCLFLCDLTRKIIIMWSNKTRFEIYTNTISSSQCLSFADHVDVNIESLRRYDESYSFIRCHHDLYGSWTKERTPSEYSLELLKFIITDLTIT